MQILFRSANKLLMDTATSEFLFCADFFSESAIFHELFSATLNAVETALATSLQVYMPNLWLVLVACPWRAPMQGQCSCPWHPCSCLLQCLPVEAGL